MLILIDSTNSFATHNLTLVRHGTENIDGVAASKVISSAGYRGTIISDGSNWFTMTVFGVGELPIGAGFIGLVLLGALVARRKLEPANDNDDTFNRMAA